MQPRQVARSSAIVHSSRGAVSDTASHGAMSVDCADRRRDGFSAQSVDPPGVSTVGMAKPLAESADPADPPCAGSEGGVTWLLSSPICGADTLKVVSVGKAPCARGSPAERLGPAEKASDDRVGPPETASDHWVDPVDSASDDWPGQVDSADEHVGPIDPAPRSRVGPVARVGPTETASDHWVDPVDSASDDWPGQVDSADEHVGPIDPAPRSRVGPVARVGPTETASDHWVDPVDSASDDWPGQVDSADEHVGPIDPAPRSRVGPVDTTPGGRVGPVDTASGDRVGPHDDSADTQNEVPVVVATLPDVAPHAPVVPSGYGGDARCGPGAASGEHRGPAVEAPSPADSGWACCAGCTVPEARADDLCLEDAEESTDVQPVKAKGSFGVEHVATPNLGLPVPPPTHTGPPPRGVNGVVERPWEGGCVFGESEEGVASPAWKVAEEPHGRPLKGLDGSPRPAEDRDPPLPTLSGYETKLEKAKITLNDCLACSGCITSAESVLITQQSQEELYKVLLKNKQLVEAGNAVEAMTVVVSVSPQARASLAAQHQLTMEATAAKLTGFMKRLGVHYVFDTNFARNFSLIESGHEFIRRFYDSETNPKAFPMLASACPGWVCYAEKTHGSYILPYISTTRSPQQVMGALVKDYLASAIGQSPASIYHVTVMPCFDKKLEASRADFHSDLHKTGDVDCVITSIEVAAMLEKEGVSLADVEDMPINTQLSHHSDGHLASHSGGGSGGYLEHIARHAVQELHQSQLTDINYRVLRNQDFKEVLIEAEGKPTLKMALAYGFRNIQNIVQKIKRKKCDYHFVEIMACPSGCNNGGAQVRPEGEETVKERAGKVEALYASQPPLAPQESTAVQTLYKEWLGGVGSLKAQDMLHTSYHEVEKMTNALAIKW
ncbi:hypothetical protein ACOMHN_024481 [Nucella lapillus]